VNEDTQVSEFYDILAACLDDVQAGARSIDDCLRDHPQYADLLRPDLQAAVLVSRIKSPRMNAASIHLIENRLLQQSASQQVKTTPSRMIPFPAARRPAMRLAAAIVIALLITFGGGGGVIRASANTMPGDTLYPVKRLWEAVIILIASLTDQLDEAWLNLAETRLEEATTLAEQGELTIDALQALQRATDQAVRYNGSDQPEFNAYLVRLWAVLDSDQLSVPGDVIAAQIEAQIVPVLQNTNRQSDNPVSPAETTPEALIELSPTASSTTTPTPSATSTANAPVQITSHTATSRPTSRIPVTPTRTPTPTVTPTPTITPRIEPTATWTPLPLILPVQPQITIGGPAQPTFSGQPPTRIPTGTWYPYILLTQDAFYLTRTAEASITPTASGD
jgi:hypothetical protein